MINLPIPLGPHSEVSEASAVAGAILSRDKRKESSKNMTARCTAPVGHVRERPAGRGPELQEKPAVLEELGNREPPSGNTFLLKRRRRKCGCEGFNHLVESTGLGVKGRIPGPVRSLNSFVYGTSILLLWASVSSSLNESFS